MPDDKPNKELLIDFRDIGATGLRRFSGFILEEFLPELTGWRGLAVYKEMSSNDATIASMIFAMRMIARQVKWRVDAASDEPFDMEAQEFLEGCREDMSMSWADTIDEQFASMIVAGYSPNEIVYKRRCGDVLDPSMRSKFQDGRIGWRKLPIRSPDTIYRWQFDDHGGIQGVEQLAPPHYYHVTIPIEKLLLFRTTIEKNNPEGRSLLRGAWRSWYMKKNLENIEAIGAERDLAGLPVIGAPPELFSQNASDAEKALFATLKQIVTNIRRDEQEGIVWPLQYDTSGKPMYELKLLSTGGSRQFDTDKIIQRYDQRMAMTVMADFLLMGHEKVGSKNLVGSRMSLFATAVSALLDMIEEVYNRYAIPRLFELNDFQISDYPKLKHGDVDMVDLEEISKYLLTLAQAGMPIFPNLPLEKQLMQTAKLPEPPDPLAEPEMQVQPNTTDKPSKVTEIPATESQTPSTQNDVKDTTPVNGQPKVTPVQTNQNMGNTVTSNDNPKPAITNANANSDGDPFKDNKKRIEENLDSPNPKRP